MHFKWSNAFLFSFWFFPFFLAVDCFKEEYVSENVLKKLIRQNVVEEVVKKETDEQFLFRENVPCDYFILILQGRCAIGKSVGVIVFDTKRSVSNFFKTEIAIICKIC